MAGRQYQNTRANNNRKEDGNGQIKRKGKSKENQF